MAIILTGFKNCGKSSVATLLAKDHAYRAVDTDDLLVVKHGEGKSARDVYNALGADGFRALERQVVSAIEGHEKLVVATGGGVMTDDDNVHYLKALGPVMYIKTHPNELFKRMAMAGHWPAFIDEEDPEGSFRAYYNSRAARYEAVADHIIESDGLSPAETALAITTLHSRHKEPHYGQ